jgi:hypothetical protein
VAGALRFELLSEGRYSKRPHGGKGGAKAKRGPDARAGSRDKAQPGKTRVRAKTRRGGAA